MKVLFYYWITTVGGIGLRRYSDIIEYFGGIESAWNAPKDKIMSMGGIPEHLLKKLVERRNEKALLKEIKDIESKGIHIITIDSEGYPERLKNIPDPPLLLYAKGKFMECTRFIGVVGSRRCTPYGRMVARTLSKELSEFGIGIISGMARGIDTEAHRGALDAGGFTCAVLGCGCDVVYPPENKSLMAEIEKKGAVVSEYPPGTKPHAQNFPGRNRIISGLSDGILVVEAGERSGTSITANFALEQGREVFAVPGNIHSSLSKGTNALIKEGARVVTGVEDILLELGLDFEVKVNGEGRVELTEDEKRLMSIINESPINFDDLVSRLQMKVGGVNALLTSLEIKGVIKILPGKYIVRIF